jgi:hypothetical protein
MLLLPDRCSGFEFVDEKPAGFEGGIPVSG